jgi:hypothetical protein
VNAKDECVLVNGIEPIRRLDDRVTQGGDEGLVRRRESGLLEDAVYGS